MSGAPGALPVTFLGRVEAEHDGTFAMSVADGPLGSRHVVGVTAGTVRGPRITATMVTGLSADWVTMRADGVWEIDVRAGFTTDDGATVVYTYTGLATRTADRARLSLRGAPRFQTGDPRYAWLNAVQAVAVGEADLRRGTAAYDLYALD